MDSASFSPFSSADGSEQISNDAEKIVKAARLHANNLLRSADELEKLINPVIDYALLLNKDRINAECNNNLEIMVSQWKTNLKQLTKNVDKCVEVVDIVSQLQQLNLRKITSCISTTQARDAMTQGES